MVLDEDSAHKRMEHCLSQKVLRLPKTLLTRIQNFHQAPGRVSGEIRVIDSGVRP